MTVPAARKAQALAIVRRGHTVNEASKRTGVSRKTIARWLAAEPAPEHTHASEKVLSPR